MINQVLEEHVTHFKVLWIEKTVQGGLVGLVSVTSHRHTLQSSLRMDLV